jgi:hypothetical protein
MFKIVKRTIRIGESGPYIETSVSSGAAMPWWQRMTAPLLFIASVAAVVFFSAILAIALIPLAIIGYFLWRRYRQRIFAAAQADAPLDAEYTVVDEIAPKND